jgi:hypothetical protein
MSDKYPTAGLKPCPFCGQDVHPDYDAPRYVIHQTNKKGCSHGRIFMDRYGWNTRPIEDTLNARIAELEEENDRLQDGWFRDETICPDGSLRPKVSDLLNRIAELSQAVGLITTMKPTMVMDANHPLDMVREVGEHVNAQVVALTAALREANEDAARLAHSNTWVQVDDDGISAACIHCGKHAKYERDVIHRPDCPITLHRARVGGAA